jgi:hypothetical protein
MIKRRASGPRATPPAATATAPAAPEAGKGDTRENDVNARIGRELQAMFEDVVAEPVPEKFRALLDELERKSRKPAR